MVKLCQHENVVDEHCTACSSQVGTCPGCKQPHTLTKDGYIVSHSWPLPTRQLCRGAGYSSLEDVARAAAQEPSGT